MKNSLEMASAATGEIANAIKDKAQQADKVFDSAKNKLADAFDKGSETLINGAEAVDNTALAAASKLANTATFLRNYNNQQLWGRCGEAIGKYPFHAMAIAAIGGLVLGRSIWYRRYEE